MIDFKVDTKFQSPLQYIMHPNIGSSDCNEKLASFDTDVTPTPKFLNFFMSQIFFAILDPTQKGGRVFWEKNPKIFFFKNLHVDI